MGWGIWVGVTTAMWGVGWLEIVCGGALEWFWINVITNWSMWMTGLFYFALSMVGLAVTALFGCFLVLIIMIKIINSNFYYLNPKQYLMF